MKKSRLTADADEEREVAGGKGPHGGTNAAALPGSDGGRAGEGAEPSGAAELLATACRMPGDPSGTSGRITRTEHVVTGAGPERDWCDANWRSDGTAD